MNLHSSIKLIHCLRDFIFSKYVMTKYFNKYHLHNIIITMWDSIYSKFLNMEVLVQRVCKF